MKIFWQIIRSFWPSRPPQRRRDRWEIISLILAAVLFFAGAIIMASRCLITTIISAGAHGLRLK